MNKTYSLLILALPLFMGCNNNVTKNTSMTNMPTANLLAYYPFNGNPYNINGNDSNETVNGATLTTDRFGQSSSVYHFTGGASILIPELFPNRCLAFTFAVWVMKDSIDNENHMILYKGLDQGEAALAITNGNLGFGVNLETRMHETQNWYSINLPDTLQAKTYYFLVGRYIKGQRTEFLINGKLVGSRQLPDLPLAKWSAHSYSAIGTHTQFPHTYYWNGIIDDIRIYDRALSDEEVQSLYHEGGWANN